MAPYMKTILNVCFIFPMKTTMGFIRAIIFIEILMITLVSSSEPPFYNILHTTVSGIVVQCTDMTAYNYYPFEAATAILLCQYVHMYEEIY